MNKKQNAEKGRFGEDIAENYLTSLGYKIIERNWHFSKNAEIDIIAEDNGALVFIEVKARASLDFGHPFEAVSPYKIKKLQSAVYAYMSGLETKYKMFRIDCIAVIGFQNPKIEHIKNLGQY